jgi:hypothetical protein
MIAVDEIKDVHARLLPRINAVINATGDDRAQHIGILCHALLCGLSAKEREFAFGYLCRVVRQSMN